VDDGLAASSIIMVFLDDGSTVGRLTLFNYSTTPVAVVVPVALANADASPNRANANADIIGQRRGSKRRNCGNYQKTLHRNLLSLLHWKGNGHCGQKFPMPSRTPLNGGTGELSARKGIANSGNDAIPLTFLGSRIINHHAVYEPTGKIAAVVPDQIVTEAGDDEKVGGHPFIHDVGWRMLFLKSCG
jgi:hypothetical protein